MQRQIIAMQLFPNLVAAGGGLTFVPQKFLVIEQDVVRVSEHLLVFGLIFSLSRVLPNPIVTLSII